MIDVVVSDYIIRCSFQAVRIARVYFDVDKFSAALRGKPDVIVLLNRPPVTPTVLSHTNGTYLKSRVVHSDSIFVTTLDLRSDTICGTVHLMMCGPVPNTDPGSKHNQGLRVESAR